MIKKLHLILMLALLAVVGGGQMHRLPYSLRRSINVEELAVTMESGQAVLPVALLLPIMTVGLLQKGLAQISAPNLVLVQNRALPLLHLLVLSAMEPLPLRLVRGKVMLRPLISLQRAQHSTKAV